ncbi:MAG: M1 family metallopeptidase [Cyclobacteriaceae bacterium]|nr:M1 family metallopeptidase [Cyclobacteriaceae bacterium]
MKIYALLFFVFFAFIESPVFSQDYDAGQVFTRKDSLRGTLSPVRNSYDVTYYALDVTVDPGAKTISGSNTIYFTLTTATDKIQIDLFENMDIAGIWLNNVEELRFEREYDAVFISLGSILPAGSMHHIEVKYGGKPQVALLPPWDGGFVWATDTTGHPQVAVACQGTGASLWWPNKDHQSDEPDSMMISVTVPKDLQNISNGRLRHVSKAKKGWTRYDWFVSYPINNYNVTLNIGKFAHFDDLYISEQGDSLTLNYYVLPQELDKAKAQFAQVRPMMDFFYTYFGPYPFVRDGYKLIQSPHLGMEHQSAVAYGNDYLNGYKGTSSSEIGIAFDFIILHETAHEWWGNNITANDMADMWLHESFGAYSEGLYVEHIYGYDQAMKYINGKKQNVKNDRPIIGPYGVNTEGSGDMYDKGQLALNTLRHVIGDDPLWFEMLKELNVKFRYQTVDGREVIDFINEKTGRDFSYFFDQYFAHAALPALLVGITKKGERVQATYKWEAAVANFNMPVSVSTAPGKMEVIYPDDSWQTIDLNGLAPDDFHIAEDQYFVELKVWKTYVDPRR